MLEFTKNAFGRFIGIILWVNLIFFTIGGGFLGRVLARYAPEYQRAGYIIGFCIGGMLIGFILNILFGGFIATIINIDKNIEKQNRLQEKLLLHFEKSEN